MRVPRLQLIVAAALAILFPLARSLSPLGVASSRRSTLYDGLIGYWKMDEGAGLTRADSTGRGNSLSDNNTVGSTTGKVGNAAQFVGAGSDFLSKTNNSDVQAGDIDFTWAGWFNVSATGGADQYILSKGAFNIDYELYVIGTSLGFQYWNSAYSQVFTATGTITAGQWYRFVAWHDSTLNRVCLKLNNDADRTANTVSTAATTTDALRVGQRGSGGNFYTGLIDELSFYKRILTANEMTEHWGGGAGVTLY